MVNVANNPFHAAVAIARMSDGEADYGQIVGSGFVVAAEAPRNSALLVTAGHVVTDEAGDALAIVGRTPEMDGYGWQEVSAWHVCPDVDLAVGLIGWSADLVGLRVANGSFPRNQDVEAIEFSRALVQNAERKPELAPLFRKGHVVQAAYGIDPNRPAVRMIELSFPAFKGSSGAPVIGSDFRAVLGVIVQNLHRDLSPSQLLTSYSEDGRVIEEIRYQVPNGLAISSEHVTSALASAMEKFA